MRFGTQSKSVMCVVVGIVVGLVVGVIADDQ
jgi:hypothetical protein